MTAPRIQDYGIIGNSRSAALVSNAGSIDWLCWPRFDSPSLFAAILDPAKGGFWRIAPTGAFRSHRRYIDNSNVLLTTFETTGGKATLMDLMPVFSEEEKQNTLLPEHEILRLIECIDGEVEFEAHFQPRPDYGRRMIPLRSGGLLGIRLEDGPQLYTLRAGADLQLGANSSASGRFRLRAGEHCHFSLTFDGEGPAVLPPLGSYSHEAAQRTSRWWSSWASQCSYQGPHRERVVRSLLALKLLCFAPSGAIVAAPTTSLPERVGGDLNWDYRFCWVRDASLTVRVLFDLGYEDHAAAFVNWLFYSTRLTRPRLHILYDVYGELPGDEETLPHLEGYRGSRPVRIRNAADSQLQLDAYGEAIDAVAQMCRRGSLLDRETQGVLRQFGDYVCQNWQQPDQGIWEPRTRPQFHTHSLVLCWAALDRLLEMNRIGVLKRIPGGVYQENHRRLRQVIEERGWNPSLSSYTQTFGGSTVDASLLELSRYGFAEPSHPRMQDTFRRIRERLEVAPGLFYRYEESRSIGEGAFGICSFWAAEFLAHGGGTLDEAEGCFERLLLFANDLGLFAEEIDPASGELLGNFPQAFTHVGLVSAAIALEKRRREETAKPLPDPPLSQEPARPEVEV